MNVIYFFKHCQFAALGTIGRKVGFPEGALVKNPPATAGDTGDAGDTDLIPGSGRSPGGRNGNLLKYSWLENPTHRGAWWATVHRVAELDTTERLSTHSRKAAYSVPGLQTVGSNPGSATSFLPDLGHPPYFPTTER